MPRRSYDEQIAEMEKKLEIQKARLKEVKARKRSEEQSKARKERTHRLIQIGAICEEVYGSEITEGAMQDALRDFLRGQDSRGQYYSGALNKAKAAPEAANADDAARKLQEKDGQSYEE